MTRANFRMADRTRKIAIPAFVLFHFWALIAWIIPPYSDMVAKAPRTDSPIGRLERQIVKALTAKDGGVVSVLARNYIDLIGAHQYWDFFAPDSPRVHRYLSVCSNIRESPEIGTMDCIEPLYQSFEGNLNNAAQLYQPRRSRSFRLVENLLRLPRPDLMNAFTLHWHQRKSDATGTAFLLVHEFTLQAGSPSLVFANKRRDEVVWIVPD